MKGLTACMSALLAWGAAGWAEAAPAGCGEAPEPEEAYVARARTARTRKEYGKVADELWSAWCRSSNFFHLVGICEAHLMGKNQERAQEILRYAERRLGSQSAEDRDALLLCKRQLEGAGSFAKTPPAQAAPAQVPPAQAQPARAAPAPAQPPRAPATPSDSVMVTVVTEPPGAKVYIDRQLYGVLGTPVTLSVPRGPHEVHLSLAGYKTRSMRLRLNADNTLTFKLER